MNTSTVALCIASYNCAHFLEELLEDVRQQTYPPVGVYVSLHGSTDDTAALLHKYRTADFFPLVVVPFKPSPGVGLNKHDVVERALQDHPDYIQMVDADDRIAPDLLRRNVVWMDAHPAWAWGVCDGELFGERSGKIHNTPESPSQLLQRNCWSSWGIFRAAVLREHNYDPRLTAQEDWDLWLRLTFAGKQGGVIPETLYYRRWHSQSLTATEDLTQAVTAQATRERILMSEWKNAQAWEAQWHGLGLNSFFEEEKQLTYAQKMGLSWVADDKTPYNLALGEQKIVDLGGGPYSLLLKSLEVSPAPTYRTVVDPLTMPSWVLARYRAANIEVVQAPAEYFTRRGYEEAWLYNVLQHVQDPEKVCTVARKVAKLVRIFEWLEMPVTAGHLHTLTKEHLNAWLGGVGRVEFFNTRALQGCAYYGVFLGEKYAVA